MNEVLIEKSCCVVLDEHCEAPANLLIESEDELPKLWECHRCGQDVCKSCLRRRKYYTYGKVVLCYYCSEEYKQDIARRKQTDKLEFKNNKERALFLAELWLEGKRCPIKDNGWCSEDAQNLANFLLPLIQNKRRK